MVQQTEQLIDIALLFHKTGNIDQSRKIAIRLIEGHRERLRQLSTIDIDQTNYSAVMAELRQIEALTGIAK